MTILWGFIINSIFSEGKLRLWELGEFPWSHTAGSGRGRISAQVCWSSTSTEGRWSRERSDFGFAVPSPWYLGPWKPWLEAAESEILLPTCSFALTSLASNTPIWSLHYEYSDRKSWFVPYVHVCINRPLSFSKCPDLDYVCPKCKVPDRWEASLLSHL